MSANLRGWIFLTGDMNWEDVNGTWGKKVGDVWYVLKFDNAWDSVGEEAKAGGMPQYYCQVLVLYLDKLPPDAEDKVLDEYELEEKSEKNLVAACIRYGFGSPLECFTGDKYPLRVRAKARRYAELCMKDSALLQKRLDKVANRIGSTSFECGHGLTDLALHHGPFGATKKLMRKIHGLPEIKKTNMPLTKKEKQVLKSHKAQIESFEEDSNLFIVKMCLTKGELLALRNGIEDYAERSPVGKDVSAYINNAFETCGIEK